MQRRKYARFSISMKVRIEQPDRPTLQGTLSNISLGGAFIDLTSPPEQGSPVRVCVAHSDGRMLSLDAVVRYAVLDPAQSPSGQTGIGVEWKELGLEERILIEQEVKSRAGSPSE